MPLNEYVSVAPRFARSVNLERDIQDNSALDGYILTSAAAGALGRVLRSLSHPGHHAWTLTGPYGSGKSAFALFLTRLLGPGRRARRRAYRVLGADRQESLAAMFELNPELLRRVYWPIVVSGARKPLATAILEACQEALVRVGDESRAKSLLRKVRRTLASREAGTFREADCLALLNDFSLALQASGRADGILLVIDELGKLLEFATRRPDLSDVHLLQQLAEATGRAAPADFLLVTVLHQAFALYVGDVRPEAKEEWAKVQGRFEDVAFQDPPEELLRLLSQAILHREAPALGPLLAATRIAARQALRLSLFSPSADERDLIELLIGCAPLHPLTALVLVRLCRKFGQNHRSLFSFLTSHEPFGLLHYLREAGTTHPKLYTLARLYDYVASTLGNGLLTGESSSRWAEVQATLERCADRPEEEIQVLKSIGILSAIGVHGSLKPSREILDFALQIQDGGLDRLLRNLTRSNVLVVRRHTDTYSLWQGSDVDLDERRREARRRVTAQIRLAAKANSLLQPRPVVAKRHSYETGTLRYFSVQYVDGQSFSAAVAQDLGTADGLLLLALPTGEDERSQLIELAVNSEVRDRPEVLVGIAPETRSLDETVLELERWTWVLDNTPELAGDAAARSEVNNQISLLREHLSREISSLFDPDAEQAVETVWYRCGIRRDVTSQRSLAQLLSSICTEVYEHTPHIRNELINRRSLSSAAAAARRNLLEALLSRSDEQRLGLEGNGPDVSMYDCVLRKTGIHRQETTGWAIGPPTNDSGLLPVWDAIEKFLKGCEHERRPATQLFKDLRKRPFGLKDGVVPILFVSAILGRDAEVAFYEDGIFVPELTIDTVERLLRQPDKFAIRTYRIEGVGKRIYRDLARALDGRTADPQTLVALVRPLYRFYNGLTPYSRHTKTLTGRAIAVRQALADAKDPDRLLFVDLPEACDCPTFDRATIDGSTEAEYRTRLHAALSEIHRSYDELLSSILALLMRTFGASGDNRREWIRQRAARLEGLTLEPGMRALVSLLGAGDEFDEGQWIEAIATNVVGKPPQSWSDSDRNHFEARLAQWVRTFRHLEAIAHVECVQGGASGVAAEVVRIGVTDSRARDHEAVVTVLHGQEGILAEAIAAVEAELERLGVASNRDLALAALALAARPLLAELFDHQRGGAPVTPAGRTTE